jgi:hypothetical protein
LQALSRAKFVRENRWVYTLCHGVPDRQLVKGFVASMGYRFLQQNGRSEAHHILHPCRTISIYACTLQESENPVSWHIAAPNRHYKDNTGVSDID